jgi:hypothetical protein
MTQNLLSLTPAKKLPADSYLAAVTALKIVRTRARNAGPSLVGCIIDAVRERHAEHIPADSVRWR